MYSYTSSTTGSASAAGDTATGTANGDLNGDGVLSTFSITGQIDTQMLFHVAPNMSEVAPEE
jgi:hypothetical protein